MKDFPDQLVLASTSLGTMLDVAVVLGVQPWLVYRWIAGVDLPNKQCIEDYTARLEPWLRAAQP